MTSLTPFASPVARIPRWHMVLWAAIVVLGLVAGFYLYFSFWLG